MKRWWSRLLDRLFPKVTRYALGLRARAAMAAMSEQTHPKEAFGVLVGKRRGDTLFVTRVVYQPFVNTERSATALIDRYAVDGLAGTFHSHPIPDARPSRADRRLFAAYPGVHCIVPYPYRSAAVYSHDGRLLGVHALADRRTR